MAPRARFLLPLLLAAATIGAAGCGSDDPGSSTTTKAPPTPEAQVRAAATRMIATHDPKVICTQQVTERLVHDMFKGSQAVCVKSSIADPPTAGSQKVGAIQVDGPRATVEVRQVGGPTDGAGGNYEFVREGATWKIDRLQTDLMRSAMTASMDAASKAPGNGAFTDAALYRCVRGYAEKLPRPAARAFISASLRHDKKEANDRLVKLAEKCPDELAGYVTKAIIKSLVKSGKSSPAFVRCAARQLRGFLSLTGLASAALKGNTNEFTTAALQGIAAGVRKNCKT